ncbi:hypothetical protein AB2L28_17235 [Kineococcus sp. TBRC 1896]|uniref:Xylulose 5-phosphate/Fructose 6-phosphate phosphoketolase C-terminal domain-containing protein n=1 Tax=Kineococcus mangrovi TaxID=1660183 RepID=A0ABV4I5L5_9ACTN
MAVHEVLPSSTPCDLLAGNGVSRHDLAAEAVPRAAENGWDGPADRLREEFAQERDGTRERPRRDGEDPEGITGWRWSSEREPVPGGTAAAT